MSCLVGSCVMMCFLTFLHLTRFEQFVGASTSSVNKETMDMLTFLGMASPLSACASSIDKETMDMLAFLGMAGPLSA